MNSMTNDQSKTDIDKKQRQERMAAALRSNLLKRKALQRAKKEEESKGIPTK
jgi:molybdenum cofactor biosynthesis enzyme